MKKNIMATLALAILFNLNAKACDICGCGVGNFNPYLFPHLANNFFSVNWQHRYYHTHFTENGEDIHNREYYNTVSVTAQYSPFKNMQLMMMLPFQVNAQYGPEGSKHLSKPGDVFLLANYKVLSIKTNSGIRHDILLGSGIKFATGQYVFDEANEAHVANSNFQAGTGSTDFLFNAYYSMKLKKISISSGINYKINGRNKENYRFGTRLQTLTQVKYSKAFQHFSLVPSLGLQTEKMGGDRKDGLKIENNHTGGYNTQAILGLDLASRKWALGINYSAPVRQNLAGGHIHAEPGLSVHISYSL